MRAHPLTTPEGQCSKTDPEVLRQGGNAQIVGFCHPLLGDIEPFYVPSFPLPSVDEGRELAIVLTKVSCSPLAQPAWPSAVFPT